MAMNLFMVFSKFQKVPMKKTYFLNLRKSHWIGIMTRSENTRRKSLERLCQVGSTITLKVRHIRVTTPCRALPPIILMLIRPFAKIMAILFGRKIRKWWKQLSPEEKEIFLDNLRKKQQGIVIFVTFASVVSLLYYMDHIYETPITKRKRFIMFNTEQINAISYVEQKAQMDLYKRDIVPPTHPFHQRIARVANKIILSNKDIPEVRSKEWTLTVVDRPEITNAFSFPHGRIFVFTGILNICTNDDQLAVVLAHEIAHAILSHVAENLSKVLLVEAFLIIPSVIFWSIFSDLWAFMSEWVTNSLAKLLIHLPFSRNIENEADLVGLQLAARSCYDVREAPIFWSKMNIVNASPVPVEWLSTHPSDETRQANLREMLPIALQVRSSSNCPTLRYMTKLSF